MDVDALLQSHGDEEPSGEDLEYDPVFTEMEIAAQPGEERQVGDEIIHGEDPDYKEVIVKAQEILGRSHDLRAAIFLAEAQLRLKGFPAFAEATSYILGCLTQYWDTCHPQLDDEDDDDPTMRINAILSLSDPNRIVRGTRRAPLTKSRVFGMITLRDIAVAEGEISAPSDMETVHDQAAIAAAFQDTDEDDLREISGAVALCLSNVEAISATFDDKTPGQGPDLDPLLKNLRKANVRIASALGDDTAAEESDGEGGDEAAPAGGGGMAAAPVAAAPGAINSPNDVRNALDRIIAYYERAEPSSPVPVILNRAKVLVGADFMTVVQNMAPNGMDMVRMISGIREDENY